MQTYENHNDIEFQANFLLINFGVHLAYVRSIANIEPQLHHVPRSFRNIYKWRIYTSTLNDTAIGNY